MQAQRTFDGKAHDLWFEAANGRATVWTKQDTVDFLKELERRSRAPATINRTLAASWLYGLPTATCGA